MDKLDTYNRVPLLASRTPHRIRCVSYIAFLTLLIVSALSPWLFAFHWIMALTASSIFLVAGLFLNQKLATAESRCRFCSKPLERVPRPLLLTPKLLSLKGKKQGNHFYTKLKTRPWGNKDWFKLSNQTRVCHHCRLTEESYQSVKERASAQELRWLNSEQE